MRYRKRQGWKEKGREGKSKSDEKKKERQKGEKMRRGGGKRERKKRRRSWARRRRSFWRLYGSVCVYVTSSLRFEVFVFFVLITFKGHLGGSDG